MGKTQRLASFCRLCLTKTKDKVPVFSGDNLLDGLLRLVEIEIDSKEESDATVCYDCVVTLEGFHQFKEQCHVNDEFIKSIPPKAESSMSAADSDDEEEEEEEDEEEEGGYIDDIDEIDHLAPSEEDDELLEPIMPKKKQSAKSSPKKASKSNSSRQSPKTGSNKVVNKTKTVVPPETEKTVAKAPHVVVKKDVVAKIIANERLVNGSRSTDAAPLEMPQLAKSYPDFFYFEKTNQSTYYTMVFYGERYNTALYREQDAKWQCIYRRKYQCSAYLLVSHDYQNFERRNEHTHDTLKQKEGKIFTPLEALPDLFKISYNIRMSKRILDQEVRKAVGVQKPGMRKRGHAAEEEDEDDSDDSDVAETRGYESGEYISEEELQSSKKSSSKKQKKQSVRKTQKSNGKESAAGYKDLERIEAELEAFHAPKRPSHGPSMEDMLVLADEYPDFFYFEKGPRSVYYSLIFYGERYHSAHYTERNTYWPCQHRRKHKCPALVAVSNDYKSFERRYEHSHEDIPLKEGVIYTPKEALPEIFKVCRRIVCKARARRRQKLLQKYKYLQALNEQTKPMEFVETDDPSGGSDALAELMMNSGVYEDEEVLDDVEDDADED